MNAPLASVSRTDRTLVDLLRRQADMYEAKSAFTYLTDGEAEETRLTYGELDRRARAIAVQLLAAGASGERVLLLYPAGLDFIAAFFGCLYAGAVAVPAYPPRVNRQLSRIHTIVSDAQAKIALTTATIHTRLETFIAEQPHLQALLWITTDTLADELAEHWREPRISESTLAFLQYTSGSTAAPKGVMISHGNLLHNEQLIQAAFRQTASSIIVGWLPLYHDMGLIGNVLQPLYLGASCVLMSPTAFLQRPARWLEAISRYRATTSGGPNFAYDLCVRKITPAQREAFDLSSWRVAYNGAEPVRLETLERFAETFAECNFRRDAFFPCYGLAEATLFVSGKLKEGDFVAAEFNTDDLEKNLAVAATAEAPKRALVSCGGVLGQQLVIVDPVSHESCAPSVVGEIWVSGPSVAQGYWNQPDATDESFRAYLADGAGPFLRTGDLGFVRDEQLFVTGRLKDLIIIRGRNYYPQDIEWTAESSHTAIAAGCLAAFSLEVEGEERLVLTAEVEVRHAQQTKEVFHAMRQWIALDHELQVYAIVLLKRRTIPKTSSGKIQRGACRTAFLNGELNVVDEWRAPARQDNEAAPFVEPVWFHTADLLTTEQVAGWFVAELASQTGYDSSQIDVRQSCAIAGLDSLGAVELAHHVERDLGVVIPPTSFLEDTSIEELAAFIRAEATAAQVDDKLPARSSPGADRYPLSRGQEALWFLHQLQPESTAYNISSALRITTELDRVALHNACKRIVQRHAVLRTTFNATDGAEPLQQVQAESAVSFVEQYARDWSEEELHDRLVEQANQPFDLQRGPLFRLHLFIRAEREHLLLLTIHHIISDFWSLGILVRELGDLYEAERQQIVPVFPRLESEYADYIRWQAEMLGGEKGEELWHYWQEQLAGAQLVLNLPFDKSRQRNQSYRGASLPGRLDRELAGQIKALGQSQRATLFMTLLAAFYTLLYRYTNQPDLLVGSPVAGRSRAGFSGVLGYFVNPLALRAQVAEEMTFKELLAQVRRTTLSGLRHQEYPFPTLVERLQPERNPGYSPVFQVMFMLQKAQFNEEGLAAFALGEAEARLKLGELELESVALKQRVVQFDLTLAMTEMEGGLGWSLQYCTDLFEDATIQRMAGHFRRLLESIVANPELPITEFLLLTPSEEQQILIDWNATNRAYAQPDLIHQLIEQQVERTPSAIALRFEDSSLTYRELNLRSNQLAHYLQELGIHEEVRVAVCLDRSIDLVVSLLAILKAGGAYVPLDPQYPRERLSFMLADAQAHVLLSEKVLQESVIGFEGAVVCVSDWWEQAATQPIENLSSGVEAENLAYVIYTSGSTGRPKGVAITHRSASTFLHWAHETFSHEELAGTLAATSICFDLSVFELFAPLSCGGTVLLVDNILRLTEMPASEQVTLINTVPSAMTELVNLNQVPKGVQTVNLAGEALKRSLTDKLHELPQVKRVVNLYGPSEDTTYSTFADVKRDSPRDPAIGRPVANTQTYIVDEREQPVPVGIAGELLIGGMGLARGYLNRPELTAERFVPDPFSNEPGARLYRTGDLARYLPDSNIEYLGRIDHQVKVRGFRIELGEIEAALESHTNVRQAVVVAHDEEKSGERRLIGYLVAERNDGATPRELRAYLKERLPEYMVPTTLLVLDEMPLTPNGKVDRKALPVPQAELPKAWATYLAGQASIEEILTGIWMEVLGQKQIGAQDNFFELGGHSLLATRVIAKARAVFQIQLPVNSIFEAPTVTGLTDQISARMTAGQRLSTPVSDVVDGDSFPLSFAQQRLWFLEQLEPGRATYNMPGGALLKGPLNVPVLELALSEVLKRHDAFRTTFASVNGEPAQVIAEHISLQLAITDLSDLGSEEQQLRSKQLGVEEAQHIFDLAQGPLVKFRLLRLSDVRHILLVTMHHIVSDGWSLGILIREAVMLYEAFLHDRPSPLPALPIQYVDFARQQREEFSRHLLDPQVEYWRQQLAGAPPLLELPLDHPRPPKQTYLGASLKFELPEWLGHEVAGFSRREGVTIFMTLLAGFQILLSRYSGQKDILVGAPIAGRERQDTEDLIGVFVNTLVLRTDLSGNPTVREFLLQVRATALAAYANQSVPFEMLVEELRPLRSMSHSPLFQVMIVMQNVPVEEPKFSELELEILSGDSETAKFDLTLELIEKAGAISGRLEYNVDLFDPSTIQRMLSHYQHLLSLMVADPSQHIWDLPLLTAEEEPELLLFSNKEFRHYEHGNSIHELVEAQAATMPESVALTWRGQALTYHELNTRANQLAHYLRGKGIGPDVCVSIMVERSLEMVVGLLGILKAGGAYVPIDPQSPPERLSLVLEDVNAAVLLTQQELLSRLPERPANVVCLDTDWESIAHESTENPLCNVSSQNIAYVIYTSGSTGKPKGVAVTHANVTRLFAATAEWFDFTARDVWTLFHSYAFDFSVWEIWGALIYGGRLVVVPYLTSRLPDEFHELLRRERVTVLNQTPSAFRQLMAVDELVYEEVTDHEPTRLALRHVIFGGEALDIKSLESWFVRYGDHQPQLTNMYGITETTVHVTYRRLSLADAQRASGSVIGEPIHDLQLYILDQCLRPVPVGVTGEIYVGGAGLARGYLHRPDITAERFVPHPHSEEPGARLYRSGDLARFQRSGETEYLGRLDQQVKIRGFRIELGEIEAVLSNHPGIAQVIVLAREDERAEKLLVAYVIGREPEPVPVDELLSYAKGCLPEYMVPASFIFLDVFPLNANGKVDRNALPLPEGRISGRAQDYVAPRTATEELLARIWLEVLGGESIGVEDNFFDLGGHSLLATQVTARAQEVFHIEIPLRHLFESPTIADLAQVIDAVRASKQQILDEPIAPVSRGGALPLSFAQQRLWFLDQLEPQRAIYNIPMAVRLSGNLDLSVLAQTLTEVIRRHESLRTTFEMAAGQPVQVIHEPAPLRLECSDLRQLGETEREAEVRKLVAEEASGPFDLAVGPLLRLKVMQLATEEHVLVLTMHHIVSDGWSLGVLMREVAALYEAFVAGQSSPLAELQVQYVDYAVWQREWLQGERLAGQLAYWRRQLGGPLPQTQLPTERVRPLRASYRGAYLPVRISGTVVAALQRLSEAGRATLFMGLLTGFKVLLARYTQQGEVIVGTPIANRRRAELEGLIGFFVNSLALRTDLTGELSFSEALARVREVTLGAYGNQDVPFEKLVEELQPERDLSRNPLFQVMFAMNNVPLPELAVGELSLRPQEFRRQTTRFDVEVQLATSAQGEGVLGTLCYNTELYEEATATRVVRHFENLVEQAVQQPRQSIWTLSLLSAAEQEQLLSEWEGERQAYPAEEGVHELFAAQAGRRPQAVALEFGALQMSYAEVEQRANQVARYLRGLGVKAEARVGLLLERSADLVIAMLGILKAGGVYVPLDPSHPVGRLAYMAADADIAVLITAETMVRTLVEPMVAVEPKLAGRPVMSVARVWAEVGPLPEQTEWDKCDGERLAYVMYTSGSTGKPKGIGIPHRGINNLVCNPDYVQLGVEERVAHSSNVSFDAATFEIWAALLNGGRLIGIERAVALSPRAYAEALRQHHVTTVFLTTALFNQMAAEEPDCFVGVKQVLFGGEAADAQQVREVLNQGGMQRLLHVYGPTENTTFSTWHEVKELSEEAVSVPIGQALSNTQIYVLDQRMQIVSRGLVGELYVGGESLARGYQGQAELTAERFVPNPFSAEGGERLYRTGDLVRWTEAGVLEFLGRHDEQVKLRGFRIELGEVEAALSSHEQVRQAVVVAEREEGLPRGAVRRLVGYVVCAGTVGSGVLRQYLRERLPEYMVPAVIVEMAELPLTANGKVDRAALPKAEPTEFGGADYVGPRTATEEIISGIWSEVLGVTRVGVEENFFDLGGHSLLVTQMTWRVEEAFGVELALREVFERATVSGVAELVERERSGEAELSQLERAEWREYWPLSYAQQRLWFLEKLHPGTALYHIPAAMRLRGKLDLEALERSLSEIVRRHEILRTCFVEVDAQPAQVVKDSVPSTLTVIDLRDAAETERMAQALRLFAQEAWRPFDLTQGPLMRVTLLRLGEEDQAALFTMHHIISDAWSIDLLVGEVIKLYDAFSKGQESPLPELPVQYRDYSVWQRDWLQGEVLQRKLNYWKDQLQNLPTIMTLPADRPRRATQRFRGAARFISFTPDQAEALTALSRREHATLFITLLAAFKALLYRYAGVADIPIGTPIAGRTHHKLEGLIGFFVNTLVLRTRFDGNISFRDLLRKVREVALNAYAHQEVPFEMLVEELQPQRSLSYAPLFQTMFTFQPTAMNTYSLPSGLRVGPLEGEDTGTTDGKARVKFDLTIAISEREQGFGGSVSYDVDLYDTVTIERMITTFQSLVDGVLADPDCRLSQLPLLGQSELQQLLTEATTPALTFPERETLSSSFTAAAARTPNATAVICASQYLSYQELNTRSNRLAHTLLALGLEPEGTVALLMEPSSELIVGLLAIIKAGGAYVPLLPQYSSEQVRQIVTAAGARILLTQQRLAHTAQTSGARVLSVDSEWSQITLSSDQQLRERSSDQTLAAVVYANLPDGSWRGVMLTHGALLREALAIGAQYELSMSDRLAGDNAATEIFAGLLHGAAIVIGPPSTLMTPAALAVLCQQERVSVLTLPVACWEQLALTVATGAEQLQLSDSLRLVVVGGPKAFRKHLAIWQQILRRLNGSHSPMRVLHKYEPVGAEMAVAVWEGNVQAEDFAAQFQSLRPTVPLGQTLPHARVYVLDRFLAPLPVGVVGEVYLGGSVVARGYHQQPALTAAHYVPSPFDDEPGTRLYRTGDLARFLPDGNLEFCSRADEHLQVNGFTFNLEEVEAALLEHEQVQQAVVLKKTATGQSAMIAYVVGLTAAETKSFLQWRLPAYMMPEAVFGLQAIPLTANYQVDHQSLLRTASAVRPAHMTAPAGSMQGKAERVAARRAELAARRAKLSPEQQSRLNEKIQLVKDKKPVQELLPKRNPEKPAPLSFAQRRLWFLDQLEPDNPVYNMPIALRLKGEIDREALQKCVNEIVRRHEALRTVFSVIDGEPVQVIQPVSIFTLQVVDLTGFDEEAREAEARRLAREEASRPFDLSRGPLLRAQLIKLTPVEQVVLLTLHHIVSDGWSMSVLRREVTSLYDAFAHGRSSPLAELSVQYADFAAWQREWLQGPRLDELLQFWREQLAGAPSVIELLTDKQRPALISQRGAVSVVKFSRQLSEALRAFAQSKDLTLFMLLLAGLNVLLYRYARQGDIVVGTPIAGRNREETENLIGFFVNTLILRTQVNGDLIARDLLDRVKKTCLDAYAHQDMPFEVLVEHLRPERNLSYTPLFQVMLVWQGALGGSSSTDTVVPESGDDSASMASNGFESHNGTAKFDLTFGFAEGANGLQGAIEYRTDLFEAATVERMARHLEQILTIITKDTTETIAEWSLLQAGEEEQLLREWNPRSEPVLLPRNLAQSLAERFEQQARLTPQAGAVISSSGTQLSYAELDRRANQLAHHLIGCGMEREERVGLLLPRTEEMIVALLGILKAGAAYLPLERQAPAVRQSQLLAEAGARWLLTPELADGEVVQEAGNWKGQVLGLKEVAGELSGSVATAPEGRVVSAEQLAYVIFTSGSTGQPKGVAVTHGNVLARVCGADYVRLDKETRLLQLAPLAFDASTLEVWGALLNGACVVQAPEQVPQAGALKELLRRERVTTMWLTASLLNAVVDEDVEVLAGVKELLSGGEALSVGHVRRVLSELPEVALTNGYGPTETTTFACCYRIDELAEDVVSVPIGRAISNTQIYVLDQRMQVVSRGLAGELYVGGAGLARGYQGHAALTAERFVPNPFSAQGGERLYRTGDLVRWTEAGVLEFLGRRDEQVKLRGFRIELGEVEAALSSHEQVRQAVVVAEREDGRERGPVRRLVGYVVCEGTVGSGVLRQYLRERLPEYMVPAVIVEVAELPLTANGKVNRAALLMRATMESEASSEFVPPRDQIEMELTKVWEDVLQKRPVGVKDNFFDSGGHSLLAIRLFAAINERMGKRFPLSTLFRHPTVEQLASAFRQNGTGRQTPLVKVQGQGTKTPFFCVHPGGGGVFRYVDLARHLGMDQPFYAFQARGLDDDTEEVETEIEQMAAEYIEAMRDVQPHGPYLIGGWSLGGLIAFEMSKQLQTQGEVVSLLAMFDTMAPNRKAKRFKENDPQVLLSFVLDLGLSPDALGVSIAEFKKLKVDEQLEAVLAQAKKAGVVSPGVTLTDVRRLWRVFKANLGAQQRYRAEPAMTRITLFQAVEESKKTRWKRKPEWKDFSTAGVEIYSVPGNHYSIVSEPNVLTLASLLSSCLDRVSADPSHS